MSNTIDPFMTLSKVLAGSTDRAGIVRGILYGIQLMGTVTHADNGEETPEETEMINSFPDKVLSNNLRTLDYSGDMPSGTLDKKMMRVEEILFQQIGKHAFPSKDEIYHKKDRHEIEVEQFHGVKLVLFIREGETDSVTVAVDVLKYLQASQANVDIQGSMDLSYRKKEPNATVAKPEGGSFTH